MIKYLFTLLICICFISNPFAQTNLLITNPEVDNILKGNYDPLSYLQTLTIDNPAAISLGLLDNVTADSLQSYLNSLVSFVNRNSGSDTLSDSIGIGAARRWAYNKFQTFSLANENRLRTSYFQFDQNICAVNQHKSVLAVLPGLDTSNHQIVLVEAHLDSRCEMSCDTSCIANGADDNGSGSVLVLELARVLSNYTFNNTIVFMLTTGEEQGLWGSKAFSQYAFINNIPIKVVQNNDIVGGTICGERSSPPSCPGVSEIDSNNIRIFSQGINFSKNKQYARYIKMQYYDMLEPLMKVPMSINIMDGEDRTGRGGDHIPFRQKGYTAVRFTSSHEHGDGHPEIMGYTDHQHTVKDVIGLDTDFDNKIDSFFIDFRYLRRNAIINGNAIAMAAQAVNTPTFDLNNSFGGMYITILSELQYLSYKIMVRTNTNDFVGIYGLDGSINRFVPNTLTDSTYYISVAAMDKNGIESIFSQEQMAIAIADGPINTNVDVLNTNSQLVFENISFKNGYLYLFVHSNNSSQEKLEFHLTDLLGRTIMKSEKTIMPYENNIVLNLPSIREGFYFMSMIRENVVIGTKKIFIY